MPNAEPQHQQLSVAARYPAPMTEILAAQDAGYRSWCDGEPVTACPYTEDTETSRFLAEQWCAGRGLARADAWYQARYPEGEPE